MRSWPSLSGAPLSRSTAAMAKRTKPKTDSPPVAVNKQPRDRALPGMADRAIRPLENVAADYADLRDQRMQLTVQEHAVKVKALALMKKYGKTIYRHNGITITVVAGEDDVKVKVANVRGRTDDDGTELADTGVSIDAGHEFDAERRDAVADPGD